MLESKRADNYYRHGDSHGMNWEEALEIVVARTGHERYRSLCSDANLNQGRNSRDAYRELMIQKAAGEEPQAMPMTGSWSRCCGGNPYGD